MKVICWNVNGIRAAQRNGIDAWIHDTAADIYLFQETKAHEEQLDDSLKRIPGYNSWFCSAKRKGYSGVAIYARKDYLPDEVISGFDPEFDDEGRVIRARYADTWIYSIYFPNGQASKERLDYKMKFYEAFLLHIKEVKSKGQNLILCGDYNTAHNEIDLARPKENEKTSGFLPSERKWMDQLEEAGFIDTFRYFNPDSKVYSWWSFRTRARERNVGWRIDYAYVNREAIDRVKDSFILNDVYGSDHCPVGIEFE